MADLMRGRWASHRPLPDEVAEFMLASQTGWNLGTIRSLQPKDWEIFSRLAVMFWNMNPKGLM